MKNTTDKERKFLFGPSFENQKLFTIVTGQHQCVFNENFVIYFCPFFLFYVLKIRLTYFYTRVKIVLYDTKGH